MKLGLLSSRPQLIPHDTLKWTYRYHFQSVNQSIKFLYCPYPQWSQAQSRDSRIDVQQQNWWNSSMASTVRRVCRCLKGKGPVKEMRLQMFLEGSNWNGWTDRRWQVVPERRGTRVKSPWTCVGLNTRDRQTNSFAWSQWTGREWWGKHGVKMNRLLFMKRFVGQQTGSLSQCGASRFWTRWSLVRSVSVIPYKSEL